MEFCNPPIQFESSSKTTETSKQAVIEVKIDLKEGSRVYAYTGPYKGHFGQFCQGNLKKGVISIQSGNVTVNLSE